MQMSDSRTIKAPREVVWEAILNPEVLKACVPGCTEMSGSAEEGFEATVVQKVGPVKATFKGQVNLEDMDAPNTVKLVGEGKGGAAGFAKGSAVVKLEEAEDGTLLTYDVDASVGGKLAQLGSRIIDGFAKKMADQFFSNFQEAVEGPSDPDAAPETEADDGKKKGWFKRMVSN
ncbi:MAG: CoxG family protein [Sagittula sp.]|uniref:CoxG family protein n=1 Tax=Sagittula sp. TaxID=2038081 RepID=UPI0040595D59